MDLTVTQRRENGLLDRTEVYFSIAHPEAGTPTRADIRKAVAEAVDVKKGVVVLDWASSEYGRPHTRGYAKVYRSKEQALSLETHPILVRNGLKAAPEAKAPAKEVPAPEKPPATPAQVPAKKPSETPAEKKPAKEKPARQKPAKEPTVAAKVPAKAKEPGKKPEKAKKAPAKKKPAKKEGA